MKTNHRRRRVGAGVVAATATLWLTACADNTSTADDVEAADTSGASWSTPALLTDCKAPGIDVAGCIGEAADGTYTSLSREEVADPWELCSVLPHLKDSTWIGINYGQVSQAKALGVGLSTSDAGGYENLAKQVSQVEDCISSGADAILLSAVSFDSLNNAVSDAAQAGIPVIDVGNGVSSTEVAGRVLQDYVDMGRMIGEHLVSLGKPMKVALFPGPAGAGWAERSRLGFEQAIKGSDVTLAEVKYGDTGKEVQLGLVEDVLSSDPDIDALVGNAVMAEAATQAVAEQDKTADIGLYGTYVTPELIGLIEAGRANCGPSEQSSLIGQMAVDYAVRVLEESAPEGGVERYAPVPMVVCGPAEGDDDNLADFNPTGSFAPEGFSPEFQVEGTE